MTQLHTTQSAFTLAFNALRKRGFTRAGQNSTMFDGETSIFRCRYRDDNGRACAVGLFIPEEKYSKALEDFGPREAIAQCPSLANLYNPEGIKFMAALQAHHDGGDTPEQMEENLRSLVAQYSLEVPA